MKLWERIHYTHPLAGFVPHEGPLNVLGFDSEDPIFAPLLTQLQPKLIVEVGSWQGASAIYMANLAPQAEILCIDTWLGGLECWSSINGHNPRWLNDQLRLRNGYPTMYEVFASNVVRTIGTERICPLALTSDIAARVLSSKGIVADMIYVDASHDYEDVKRDILNYWPLVREGGVMVMDDYGDWPGVTRAIDEIFDQRPIYKRMKKAAVGKGFDIRQWEGVK